MWNVLLLFKHSLGVALHNDGTKMLIMCLPALPSLSCVFSGCFSVSQWSVKYGGFFSFLFPYIIIILSFQFISHSHFTNSSKEDLLVNHPSSYMPNNYSCRKHCKNMQLYSNIATTTTTVKNPSTRTWLEIGMRWRGFFLPSNWWALFNLRYFSARCFFAWISPWRRT